ncbi:MAG: RHS repeat-associated core domain-containing protein [Blastocatellia bacterium]
MAHGVGVGKFHCAFLTSYERDSESGLDFAQARYYGGSGGRFTSADSLIGSPGNPQTLNKYTYVLDNPLKYIDPTGHVATAPEDARYRTLRDWALADSISPSPAAIIAGAFSVRKMTIVTVTAENGSR